MEPGNPNVILFVTDSKRLERENEKRIYLIPWRPEESEELTNPLNGFGMSFFNTFDSFLDRKNVYHTCQISILANVKTRDVVLS